MTGKILENNRVEVEGTIVPISQHHKNHKFNVGDEVFVRMTQDPPKCDPLYCEGDETCIMCYTSAALVFTPLHCKVHDRVESIITVDNLHVKGDEGTVTDIVGYGIDILMDNGQEIRVINSDFPTNFKII